MSYNTRTKLHHCDVCNRPMNPTDRPASRHLA